MKEAIGLPNYVSVASKSIPRPTVLLHLWISLNRRFTESLTRRNQACYKCKACGSLYCSYMCKKSHEETKCINMN